MSDQMVQAQVLWDNLLRLPTGATVTYDGTTVVGFEYVNAYDWRDFSMFFPTAGSHIVLDCAASHDADSLCVWWVDDLGTDTVTLEWWDGAAWNLIATASQGIGTGVHWIDFAVQGALKWRLTMSGIAKIRELCFGVRLQFPMGQWLGINPPKLLQGVVVQNVISMNGSIIGRNLRRIEKGGKIDLSLLLPDWIRTYWEVFAAHAATKAFFYRWNPVGYPDEVAFAVAASIEAPVNASPPPRMSVSMPIKFIT